MTFPTLNNIGGIISANQFNQATNANIIGTITRNQNTGTTSTATTTPITAINPDDRNAAAFGRQINANGTVSTSSTSSYYSGPTNPGGYAQSASNFSDTIVPVNNSSSSYYSGPTNPGGYAQSAVYSVSNQGNDVAFKTPVNTQSSAATASGPRLYNPLSKLISYTYNLSLYMVTPEEYGKFVDTGETSLQGMFVVAESGGTNRDGSGGKPLFQRDYYIDDLSFKTFVNTKSTDGPTVDSTQFEFKIYEPYGFKFLSELKNAALRVSATSKITNGAQASHHMQQIYLLGVKFYGYDSEGNPVKGSGGTDEFSLFPRYFTLTLTGISFKLDGKATTYSIKAQNTSVQAGFGVKRHTIKDQIELKGKTVEEVLSTHPTDSLIAVLNKFEDNLITGGANKTPAAELKNVFKIKFIDDGSIRSSLLVDETDNEIKNYKAGTSTIVKSTNESNDKNSQKATASFDRKNRTFSLTAGTTYTQAIDNIIGHSSYVRDSINKQYKEDPEPEVDESAGGGDKKAFQWFNITPVAKPIGYDNIRKGYVYEITYIVNNYKIPYLRSPFINKTTSYPGPHKKYFYIYTGQNNEILSYEQNYNALYYMNSVQTTAPNTYPSVEVNMMSKQNEADATTFGKAGEAAASIRTSLYSPGDKASAKISILGDPDFLVMTTGMNYDIFPKRYGKDNTVDPHDGQVFIEIKFNEAIDYDNNTGLMKPSDNVEIYKYPPELEKVLDGAISYMVVDIVSTFSRGRFTQDLSLILWSPPWTNTGSAPQPTNTTASQTPVNNTSSSYYSGPTNPGGYAQSAVYGDAQRSSQEASAPTTYAGKQATGMPQVATAQKAPDPAAIIAANQFNQRTNASIVGAITSPTNPKPNQAVDDDNSQSSKDMDWIKSRSYF